MKYRAIVIEDDESLRSLLWNLFDMKGYEILAVPHPGLLSLNDQHRCACSEGEICSDLILADHFLPVKKGLEFLAEQQRKGCKCPNMGIMSGGFEQEHLEEAEARGIKVFEKPLSFRELDEWLKAIERGTSPGRLLLKRERTDGPGHH